MNERGLPQDVERFVLAYIQSVEQLEILLLLREDGGDWTARRVSDEMRTGEVSALARLKDLESHGFLRRTSASPPTFRYAPRSKELDESVASVAAQYGERRYTIINLIFSRPIEKIRVFAKAFRLRPEEEEDDDG